MTTTISHAMRRLPAVALLLATAFGSSALHAQPADEFETLHIRWIGATPENGIHVPYVLLALHNGEVDVFDHDRPSSILLTDTLEAMRPPRFLRSLLAELFETSDDAVYAGMRSAPTGTLEFGTPPPFSPRYEQAIVAVQPDRHRFLS